jgi:hypothetical protein
MGPGQELIDASGRPQLDELFEGVGEPGLRIDAVKQIQEQGIRHRCRRVLPERFSLRRDQPPRVKTAASPP